MASTHTLLVIYKTMAILNVRSLKIFTCEIKGPFPSLSQTYTHTFKGAYIRMFTAALLV